ncbi:mycofactocin oligosaccharide methyltransferase MftM [Streptomyces purpurogeneiscleroticus]|uniref:mycofactocin oligosaccharide methyltransferase MftM n=1 Tax=Streptomyces purpurogeneiscleroticus TaxID=68259 RepID=UPI001CC0966D|nr:mycofactocin oligosaccharide methyltransferase MftM [Streptomyces purpurogeneiscleroticus]MBZ4016559.1 SAM-dependent methyltransferase [Streptomyces purpurogeneiscleroticus]
MSVPDLRRAAQRIDPLAPNPPGRYADDVVAVIRESPPQDRDPGGHDPGPAPIVRTEHFCLRRRGRRVEVGHWLRPGQLDNDLAGLLAEELFAPGWLSGPDIFERVFTGVVRSCVDGPLTAWTTFYENTLARIQECWQDPATAHDDHSSIAGFAPVYRRTLDLVEAGTVLDMGSCFGFLPLMLARRPGHTVIASDLSRGTMRLLGAVAEALGQHLSTLACDASRVPLPDASVDTVTVIHVLEHLDPQHGDAVLDEALRLARRRVVVAVPYEDEPTSAYGHIQCFDEKQLHRLGRRTGRPFTASSYHGGWLVLDAG